MRWRAADVKRELDELRRLLDEYEGEADEQLRELDFAGASADARLDLVAFPMARRGLAALFAWRPRFAEARRRVTRCGGRARPDDGIAVITFTWSQRQTNRPCGQG